MDNLDITQTVWHLLQRNARYYPDTVALIAASRGRTNPMEAVSYAKLEAAARRVASGLQGIGVKKGERIGLLLDNTSALEALTAYHAAHLLGAINVPLNTRFVAAELVRAVKVAGITTILADERLEETVRVVVESHEVGPIQVITVGDGQSLLGTSWDQLLSAEPITGDGVATSTDDADWIFTSGTTGSPKAARFTHAASVACGDAVRQAWTLGHRDVYQSASPFSTSTGIHTSPLGALSAAATYLVEPTSTLDSIVENAIQYQVTVTFLVSTLVKSLIEEHRQRLPNTTLRRIVYGGMALPERVHRDFYQVLTVEHGIELMHLMGLTEGGPTGLYLGPEHQKTKPGSVGNRAFSDATDFCVVNETGSPAKVGEIGELCFRGPSLMAGYVQHSGVESAIVDGWLRTGDLVRTDEDGFVFFEDRSKDIVRRGGVNISSAEVENVLLMFPAVKGAAVVPKPHDLLGEDLCAFIEVGAAGVDIEELRKHCSEHLASFKIPRDIRTVAELPRNAMGRVVKASLRETTARL